MVSIFVYFKAPVTVRARALLAVNDLGASIASSTGAAFNSARRNHQPSPGSADCTRDTWLEHYRCADNETAVAVLARLNHIDPAHPLMELIDGGFAGRHLEHFVDTPKCA